MFADGGAMKVSVVVPSLKKIDTICAHQIDKTVLLGYAPGPGIGGNELEGLRFANAFKRITKDVFDDSNHAQGRLAIMLDPVLQILDEFRLKDGFARATRQGPPRP